MVKTHSPSLQAQALLELRRRGVTDKEAWPTEYINKETGKPYRPHFDGEQQFVYSDTPRYGLLKGGEGCIAAETIIDGVPAAEWNGGRIRTLYGFGVASKVYLKGRADLYQVRTMSGREVTVTGEHRFLTPTGWRQLQSLCVGELIALCDNENDSFSTGKSINYLGYYLEDFHPCGELTSPMVMDVLDKLQQLVETADSILNRIYYVYSNYKCPFRSYKKYYDFREVLTLSRFYVQRLHFLIVSELLHRQAQPDSLFVVKNNLDYISQLLFEYLQMLLFCFQMDDLEDLVSYDNIELTTQIYLVLYQFQKLLFLFGVIRETFLSVQQLTYISNILSNVGDTRYQHYTTYWDIIQDIRYKKFGDYYDLSVYGIEHYEANGIIHHNSGKSTAGIIKDLERLRRGCNGIFISPDLPHFKKSLWREFRNWCPVEAVIPSQRYRLATSWQPQSAFEMVFINGATLICGGIENPGSWEGPNVNFAHLDEGRHAYAAALKVLDGRCRISGPAGEPPQLWITTTPRKNWLFDYFGPLLPDDKFANFKQSSIVVTLPVELNKDNLAPGYVEARRNSLTAAEARVLMEAEWEDEQDVEKFVNIFWWDACYDGNLPPLTYNEAGILSLDAATGSETTSSLCDCFAASIITRHPHRPTDNVAVRYCGIWQAQPGHYLDFEPIEIELLSLCKRYSIIELTYDVTQLHDMAMRFRNKHGINVQPFNQAAPRLIADKQLQTLIMGRRIAHDGNPLLRQHIDNADIKKYGQDGIRIVKRSNNLKVDAAVSVSQGAARALYYNIS